MILQWIIGILILGFCPEIVTAQADDFDFKSMMDKDCPNFRCSKGHTAVPKSRPKFDSTGCYSMGGGAMMMNPGGEGADEKPFESCCHQWHACYQICGVSKKTCDATFETCSKAKCGNDEACNQDLNLSNMMMKLSGCKTFDEAQYLACECTPSDNATNRRESAIRYFYKKQAPESLEKAKMLAAKADTPLKMAGLFIKLLLKYPDAIEKKEDPMQAMFDKIKNDKPDPEADYATDEYPEDNDEPNEKIEL